ncbi:MAG: TIGR03617 family F420-dependent LLM class oxidoreductase [Gammaproteobacteria bacterium]|nr:TIGR03617 family F420-dependent LLM class oxidoreductase [Gammaproteobacteria bacterium]
MKVDGDLSNELATALDGATYYENMGFDGIRSTELYNDPFLPLTLVAEHSKKLELRTGIAVGFGRSPLTLASVAHDLNVFSQGRFTLGLGSQVKAHITKRFSMPWGAPARKMKELLQAIHAIWDSWYAGKPLDFQGEFYTHTLMTPMFSAPASPYGKPRIVIAAVGPLMCQTAGEVADGVIAHSFTTEKYMREVTLPNLEKGLAVSGRTRAQFEIAFNPFVISGRNEDEFQQNRVAACKRIAFYASTPAYEGVLEIEGYPGLQGELNAMSKKGLWDEMGGQIEEALLNKIAIVAEPGDVVAGIKKRYGDVIDRTSGDFNFAEGEAKQQMIQALQQITRG